MQTKDKSLPLSHLAHDLNNILTRILNGVELLKKKVANYDEVSAILNSIENGTYMAAEIIEDVISESINKTPRKKRINFNVLITDLTNTLGIQLKEKINFVLKLEPQLYLVEGRYSDFYRILLNLIVNAVEAIKAKGTITISTANLDTPKIEVEEPKLFDNQSYIQIKIADTGVGIDSSVIPHIFDENFTTKNKIKNRGIGLSIVSKIVNNYNGSIKVKSEKGKGTEFTIVLPSLMIRKKSVDSKKTILIAEDEIILRELLTELLESYNYKVITASNGNEVLLHLGSKILPDLLIIDQKMPDIDGLSCIKKIKELNYDLPIIFASGSQSEELKHEELIQLVNRVINKPYNFDEMLSIIRELIG